MLGSHARSRMLQLVGALVLLAAPLGAQDPLAGLDDYVARVMRDWEAPGVAVAVVKDDRVVFSRGFGVRHVNRPERVDEHTLFAIASTSKAFTTAAVGMLVDAERIRWDDRVIDHMPEFRLFDPYATREMTVRDLLSHRSGLPRGDGLWYLSPFDRDEVIRRVRLLEPARSFRARYGYQNIMFLTAGELVEAVTDTTWDDFVRAHIFEPLGMRRTTTTVRDLEQRGNTAEPHGKIDGTVAPIGWRSFDNIGGAGAIISSAADMAEWIRLQLGRGEHDGERLLSEDVIEEMHTAQTVVPRGESEKEMFPETHFSAYGLGWRLNDYRGRLVVRHGGALDGMRTHVLLVPEEHLGVVAITNVNESAVPQAIVWHVADQYLGPRDRDWNAAYLAEAERGRARADSARARRESERVADTRPSHDAADYGGRYEGALYGTAVVQEDEGRLVLEMGPHMVGDLEHWHFDVFRVTWRDRYLGSDFVTFWLDLRGQVAEVEIEGYGTFERVRDRGQ
jgi:CubicO group peptidase (beta-lactamase class C family)